MEDPGERGLPFPTRKMLNFEQGTTFGLSVAVNAVTTVGYSLTGFTKEGPFTYALISAGTGSNETFTFPLPDIPIMLTLTCGTKLEPRNKFHAIVYLTVNGTRSVQLTSGYASGQHGLSWPVSLPIQPLQNIGYWATTSGSNPAAGAQISDTIPTRKIWRLRYVEFTLVAAAAAANRSVSLLIKPLNGFTIQIPAGVTQIISETKKYIFYEGANAINDATNNVIVNALPRDLWLPASSVIATLTANLDANDDFGAPVYGYEEHFMGAST